MSWQQHRANGAVASGSDSRARQRVGLRPSSGATGRAVLLMARCYDTVGALLLPYQHQSANDAVHDGGFTAVGVLVTPVGVKAGAAGGGWAQGMQGSRSFR